MNPNRKLAFRIGQDELRYVLALPEGTEIKAVQATIDPPSFWVVATNDDWPEQPDDCEAPLARTVKEYIDGRVHVRYLDFSDEPAIPGLHTEYEWQSDDGEKVVIMDTKADVIQWLSSHGGKGRMRLVSEWDAFPEAEKG